MKHKATIRPPYGYQWSDGNVLDASDTEALREVAISMSHDPEFTKEMANATQDDLIAFFKENGFEFIEE